MNNENESSVLPKKKTYLKGHRGPVFNIKFNNDGTYCMSCGNDRTIKLWNPHKKTMVHEFSSGHSYEILDIDISKDNSRFVSCGVDRQIFEWNVTKCRIIKKYYGHEQRVNAVCYNEESSVVVSGSYDKTVKIWDCKSNSKEYIQMLDDATDSITSLLVFNSTIYTGSVDGCLRCYDIRKGKLKTDYLHQPISSISLSRDGNCILTTCLDQTLRLLDKHSGELLNEYSGHVNEDYKLNSCLNFDDSYVISGSEDGYIYYWDLVEENQVVKRLKAHKRATVGISQHPDSPMLLSCSLDSTICVWE
eukprot:TRINITY_DN2150_c0_g1_i1.p1 TRINITY_DN2150_c0_g1~~TRINITY_DN2150_c0_g1_i1.p1  ORF type:complete len:304 (-),score=51.23 TRINITY_DN2150_c0_g1_i1:237-1148(-)